LIAAMGDAHLEVVTVIGPAAVHTGVTIMQAREIVTETVRAHHCGLAGQAVNSVIRAGCGGSVGPLPDGTIINQRLPRTLTSRTTATARAGRARSRLSRAAEPQRRGSLVR
jgi:hypothetical protein